MANNVRWCKIVYMYQHLRVNHAAMAPQWQRHRRGAANTITTSYDLWPLLHQQDYTDDWLTSFARTQRSHKFHSMRKWSEFSIFAGVGYLFLTFKFHVTVICSSIACCTLASPIIIPQHYWYVFHITADNWQLAQPSPLIQVKYLLLLQPANHNENNKTNAARNLLPVWVRHPQSWWRSLHTEVVHKLHHTRSHLQT